MFRAVPLGNASTRASLAAPTLRAEARAFGAATMPLRAFVRMFLLRLTGVLILVVLNGFFAAVEFSLVAVRISRVRQLVARGNAQARIVEYLLGDLHRVVSGVQVGITLTSLAIGALGEITVAG